MERKNLYIDFDGVILDTITPLYEDYQKQNVQKENRTAFYENYPWHTIIDDKYIINDSIGAIQKIIDSDKFNLAVLTHINSLNEAILKIKYLRRYFKDITIIPCPKAISKTLMIHTKDAILIDDYSGNLKTWEGEGGISIKFSQEPKKSVYTTISDLTEIIDMF
jgi:hypothetical protein